MNGRSIEARHIWSNPDQKRLLPIIYLHLPKNKNEIISIGLYNGTSLLESDFRQYDIVEFDLGGRYKISLNAGDLNLPPGDHDYITIADEILFEEKAFTSYLEYRYNGGKDKLGEEISERLIKKYNKIYKIINDLENKD